jgi:hypothetical protein
VCTETGRHGLDREVDVARLRLEVDLDQPLGVVARELHDRGLVPHAAGLDHVHLAGRAERERFGDLATAALDAVDLDRGILGLGDDRDRARGGAADDQRED